MMFVVVFMLYSSLVQGFCLDVAQRNRKALISAPRRASASDDDDQGPLESGIPQLPAIGSSSFSTGGGGFTPSSDGGPSAFVSRKFELQYTCGVCETRNCHSVSRIAYRNGVVIARCKGCKTQHLIADNLGWTDYKGGFQGETNTIEDFFSNSNNVHRVSPEVFSLEKKLGYDTKSGSIVGDDGKPALE